MKNPAFRERTKQFALRIIRMYGQLPRRKEAQVIGEQVLRSGTGVGANYREACRARSTAEFISKMGIVEQELDETLYWMELLIESATFPEQRMKLLYQEADELLRITVAAIRKAKVKARA